MYQVGDKVQVLAGSWKGLEVIVAHGPHQTCTGPVWSCTYNGIGKELGPDQIQLAVRPPNVPKDYGKVQDVLVARAPRRKRQKVR
jgi:hypothetical protein